MKKIISITLLLLSLVTLSQAEGDKMTLTAIDGKKIHITGSDNGLVFEEFKGKVIFLEFFGHRCPPCLASIPHLKQLQSKYDTKLAIVAVEVQGLDEAQLKTFVAEKGINYTAVAQDKSDDLVSYITTRAQWQGSIPFTVVLDKKGDVQLVQAGMIPEDMLEEIIQKFSK